MIGLLMESVVIAFAVGAIIGAVTALHLLGPKKIGAKLKAKAEAEQRHRGHQERR